MEAWQPYWLSSIRTLKTKLHIDRSSKSRNDFSIYINEV